jgi:ribosomal protein S18 acetylase RimI-like enzyme
MATVNPADISLRPATAKDEAFLKRVHEAARQWEFAWLLQSGQAELYHKIIDQQYRAQHEVYFASYDTAQYGILQWTDISIGRLYVHYRDHEVRVLDIAILPEYRNRGIGGIVMKGLCIEAGMRRAPIRLHVHYLSPALRLYQKLGFRRIGEAGPAYFMEWQHPDPEALMRGQFLPQSVVQTVASE